MLLQRLTSTTQVLQCLGPVHHVIAAVQLLTNTGICGSKTLRNVRQLKCGWYLGTWLKVYAAHLTQQLHVQGAQSIHSNCPC